jgi:hypothetical protein
MRRIVVVFEDNEFERLKQFKGTKNWHDFVMELAKQ